MPAQLQLPYPRNRSSRLASVVGVHRRRPARRTSPPRRQGGRRWSAAPGSPPGWRSSPPPATSHPSHDRSARSAAARTRSASPGTAPDSTARPARSSITSTPADSRRANCWSAAATAAPPAARPAPPSTATTPTNSSPPDCAAARPSPPASPRTPASSPPSPRPASAPSTTSPTPAAATAATLTPTTTRSWAPRSTPSATTTQARCCGTRTPRPYGHASPPTYAAKSPKPPASPSGPCAHHATLSYAKVAEYQKRGQVHFHAVIRLDGPTGPTSTPPAWATTELLDHAVRAAATRTRVHHAGRTAEATAARRGRPRVPARRGRGRRSVFRFGRQIDVRAIRSTDFTGGGPVTDRHVAAYIAKYATKGAETTTGTLDRRLRLLAELATPRHHRPRPPHDPHRLAPRHQPTDTPTSACANGPTCSASEATSPPAPATTPPPSPTSEPNAPPGEPADPAPRPPPRHRLRLSPVRRTAVRSVTAPDTPLTWPPVTDPVTATSAGQRVDFGHHAGHLPLAVRRNRPPARTRTPRRPPDRKTADPTRATGPHPALEALQ